MTFSNRDVPHTCACGDTMLDVVYQTIIRSRDLGGVPHTRRATGGRRQALRLSVCHCPDSGRDKTSIDTATETDIKRETARSVNQARKEDGSPGVESDIEAANTSLGH